MPNLRRNVDGRLTIIRSMSVAYLRAHLAKLPEDLPVLLQYGDTAFAIGMCGTCKEAAVLVADLRQYVASGEEDEARH
jgi:hypothetical protein